MMQVIRPNGDHRFPLLERPCVRDVALGNGTLFRIGLINTDCGILVAVVGRGAYEFAIRPDVGYVAEKFKLKHLLGDAGNLTDFICDQLGFESEKRHGYYEASCLAGYVAPAQPGDDAGNITEDEDTHKNDPHHWTQRKDE